MVECVGCIGGNGGFIAGWWSWWMCDSLIAGSGQRALGPGGG